jgi:hypothetical protein
MKKNLFIPLRLGFFGEGAEPPGDNKPGADGKAAGGLPGAGGGESGEGGEGKEAGKPPKGFSRAGADGQAAKALDGFKQNELPGLIAAALAEEAEKAKMTDGGRAGHEAKQRDEDYNRRLAELTRRELRVAAHGKLAEKGLPAGLLDALNYSGEKSMEASLAAVEAAVRDAAKAITNEALRGTPPKGGGGGGHGADAMKQEVSAGFGLKFPN